MVKRIVAGGFIGWAGIVALAWWLAHWRIEMCRFESNCVIRTTAARDHILTSGLTVALIGAVLAAVTWSVIRARNGDWQTSIPMRPLQPSRRPTKEIAASLAASFNRALSRLPHVRQLLAMAFGMCLAVALLAWGGMIRGG